MRLTYSEPDSTGGRCNTPDLAVNPPENQQQQQQYQVAYGHIDIVECAVNSVNIDFEYDYENQQPWPSSSGNCFQIPNGHDQQDQITLHFENESRSLEDLHTCEVTTTQNLSDGEDQNLARNSNMTTVANTTKSNRKRKKKKSTYKHVPHCEKPPQVVAKRNARERRRVHAVNQAFVRLGKTIPFENKRGKRVSKVRVLQKAIDYIQNLHEMVCRADGVALPVGAPVNSFAYDDSHLFAF